MSRTHCSHCGAPVPRKASACPDCGSDEETGWAPVEQHHEASFGAFTDEDYEEVVRDLEGRDGSRSWFWIAVAVVALLAFILVVVV